MGTLNISMPDALRLYVEQQAARGHYSTSEYVRHLIREDQKRQEEQSRALSAHDLLGDYLALGAGQLDDGDLADVTVEELLAQGRSRRRTTPA